MKNKAEKRGLRSVLLELGAIIPTTDEEVALFEKANEDEIQSMSNNLGSFELILKRGKELLKNQTNRDNHSNSDGALNDFAMAAREGKNIPEHIKIKMAEHLARSTKK